MTARPTNPSPSPVAISIDELVRLAAVNSELYTTTFFPKTARQKSPSFDKEVWDALDDPSVRLLNLQIFRGGTKTTKSRLFASKRIAYGISRTILYVGASEAAALRSIRWLRAQVEKNHLWAGTFGLAKGEKWQEGEIEIRHKLFDHPIWVLGVGITGSNIRGINFDDYRPDLIILDDILTDENTLNLEQRTKIEDLVYGALYNSLTPATEEPNAKMAMLVTSQHKEDVSHKALSDPQFKSIVIPCWTPGTMNLEVEAQVSIWPERFTSAQLRTDKIGALGRNKLSTFIREMECRLTSPEMAEFRLEWLQRTATPPQGGVTVISCDPVPPPSERELAKGLAGKDFEVVQAWRRVGGAYYLLESRAMRGHNPNWTMASIFEMARNYGALKIVAEMVNYQRVLKWLLEKEMERRRTWYQIVAAKASKSKYNRIVSAYSSIASQGKIFISPLHTTFASQFETYPNVDHDDELDAGAMALHELVNPFLETYDPALDLDDGDVVELEAMESCP